MTSTRVLALVYITSLTLVACDDDDDDTELDVTPVQDAGVDVVGTDGLPGTCDPVLQNCPAGQQCVGGCNVAGVMAKVFTCAVPAPGAIATHGQPCGIGCAAGNDCFVVPAEGGGTRAVCRRYCNTDTDCPIGSTCVAEGLICTPGDPNPIGRVCSL